MSAPEGSTSSAKTVDPQFHFKGMEVWKQAGETHTEKERAKKWGRIGGQSVCSATKVVGWF